MKRPAAFLAILASGCASMEPAYLQPVPAIPASWPAGDAYLRQSEASLPAVTYQQVFRDPRLQSLIEQALVNNRDLQVAAANVAAGRARYRIQHAQQFPQVNASTGVTVAGSDTDSIETNYQAGFGVNAFELDLFGRLKSLSHAELNRYFATEAAARATRLALVSDVADAWLAHAADSSLLQIAKNTAESAERSVRLTRARLEGGIAPRTDLRQAEQVLAQAQADLAVQTTAVAQDINLLQLLVGAPFDAKLLSNSIDEAFGTVAALPAGVDSYVLLRRPDVVEAEYQLRAANAEIGAARAALFPRISLTGLLGLASTSLGGLFSGGAFGFSGPISATYPIFNAGAGRANVRLTEAQREVALATYQKAIQTALREVSDALARRGTMAQELDAREKQNSAAADAFALTDARYRAGIDDFLATLVSQRAYYTAQQSLVSAKLTAARNLVDVYQTLGGDSLEPPAATRP